jgi:hypothetical protein
MLTVANINLLNCFGGEKRLASKIDSIIFDNKNYIIEYGTVADYLLADLIEGDNQEYSWMTDECIYLYDSLKDSAEKALITDLLFDFIKTNYNYTLS